MSFIIRSLCKNLKQSSFVQTRNCVTAVNTEKAQLPIISSPDYIDRKLYIPPREAWIENLDTVEEKKLGLLALHPDVFGATPRVDIIHLNVRWQILYRHINYKHSKVRSELPGGNRKPWPQKGTGRARHGSVNSPLFVHGGKAHGPRSHKTHFYMLPFFNRLRGLTSCFSVKLAQDDLHIVPNLNIPSDDPKYFEELIEKRNWGPSVLIVDVPDIFPEKRSSATNRINHGLNVYSMLKHNTLVLTEKAVRDIEEKILYSFNRMDNTKLLSKYKPNNHS